MKSGETRIPELLLEQMALGEISPDDERWLRERLGEPELDQKLSALRAQDRAFFAERPAEELGRHLEGRVRAARAAAEVERTRRRALRLGLPALAVTAAAVGLALLPAGRDQQGNRAPLAQLEDDVRIKGLAPHLVLHRRAGKKATELADGAHATRGDVLQLGYVAATARYGVIFSVDGASAVTLHFPDQAAQPTQLQPKGEQLLDHAYELDAAPAFERFFFVTSDKPIDVDAVLEAARSLARTPEQARKAKLPLPAPLAQQSLTLVKE